VSKVFTVAQERGGVGIMPKFPRKREAQGRIRFLSDVEEGTLLDQQWDRPAARDLCVLLIDPGLRVGEALRLRALSPREPDGCGEGVGEILNPTIPDVPDH
jgi:hypothetical protein